MWPLQGIVQSYAEVLVVTYGIASVQMLADSFATIQWKDLIHPSESRHLEQELISFQIASKSLQNFFVERCKLLQVGLMQCPFSFNVVSS